MFLLQDGTFRGDLQRRKQTVHRGVEMPWVIRRYLLRRLYHTQVQYSCASKEMCAFCLINLGADFVLYILGSNQKEVMICLPSDSWSNRTARYALESTPYNEKRFESTRSRTNQTRVWCWNDAGWSLDGQRLTIWSDLHQVILRLSEDHLSQMVAQLSGLAHFFAEVRVLEELEIYCTVEKWYLSSTVYCMVVCKPPGWNKC